jgi:RNA polymerase sigma-70 factor (ECF subfamily)
MHDDDSDEALMLRYQAGDAGAFDALYARHRGGLFRFIARQCRTKEQIEEIFQDVWMNLIQARERYHVGAQFRTYLYTLAHNRMIDHFRRHARSELALFENEAGETAADQLHAPRTDEPAVRAQSNEQGAAILRAIAALPAPQREAFLLHEEAGLSIEEIAQAVGIGFETAKSRLRYAIARLRESLREVA